MSSIGLAQLPAGNGASASSILKSPLAERGTPAGFVLSAVKGGVASQINVANTFCPVALPALLPPAKIKPLALNKDVAVRPHARIKIFDRPELPGEIDTANDVLGHVRKISIAIGRARPIGDRMDANAASESCQRIIGPQP